MGSALACRDAVFPSDLCNICNLIFQMSSCSFSPFSAASGLKTCPPRACLPSPALLLSHMFTLCCLSWISSLPSASPPPALSCPALSSTGRRTDEDDGEDESGASRGGAHDNLYRVHMPSLYSCGSSYGSEASLPATAHTVSNAPVTEYM